MFTESSCPLDPNQPIQYKQFKKHSDPYGHLKIFFLWYRQFKKEITQIQKMISSQTYTLENYRLKQQEMIDIPREN